MHMNKPKNRTLSLRTETLRSLDQVELLHTRGALAAVTDGYVCEQTSRGISCWGPCATWIPTCRC
jgi:hypothetical protein